MNRAERNAETSARADMELVELEACVEEELRIAEADERLVSMVNVLVVERDRIAVEVCKTSARIDDAHRHGEHQGERVSKTVLGEQSNIREPQRRDVTLWRFIAHG